MNENILKVKFKLNGLEFEMEGKEETVISESAVYRKFVIENLFNVIKIEQLPASFNDGNNNNEEIIDIDYPAMKELVMKDIPKTEIEWVLIYAFYSSNFGSEPFKEEDIKSLYDSSKRKNSNRMKNFSANFGKNVSNNFIKILNETEYIITQLGKDNAVNILTGKTTSKKNIDKNSKENKSDFPFIKTKKGKTKSRSTNPSQTLSLITDLNLNPKDRESLKDFYKKYTTSSYYERNVLFLYYLKQVLYNEVVGINHIYTCYKYVTERVPGNLYQSIIDTKNTKGWIDSKNIHNLLLTISGEGYVEHDLPKI